MAHLPGQVARRKTAPPLVLIKSTPLPVIEPESEVIDVEPVDLDALLDIRPIAHPPVTREQVSCRCGKRSIEAHGGFSCDEVLSIAGTVAAGKVVKDPSPLRTIGVPVLLWALGVVALVGAMALVYIVVTGLLLAITAWLAANWPILAAIVVVLVLLGGGGACAGIHCGGCRG